MQLTWQTKSSTLPRGDGHLPLNKIFTEKSRQKKNNTDSRMMNKNKYIKRWTQANMSTDLLVVLVQPEPAVPQAVSVPVAIAVVHDSMSIGALNKFFSNKLNNHN